MKKIYSVADHLNFRMLLSAVILLVVNTFALAQINTVLDTQIRGELTAVARGSTAASYVINVPKPAGATTVNKIFVYYSATTLSSADLGANVVTLNGVSPNLSTFTSSSYGYCRYAEVSTTATALVSTLNSLTAGSNTNVTVSESSTAASLSIDGVGMLILWNVPSKAFGKFVIQLGTLVTGPNPATQSFPVTAIDKTLPGFNAIMGIGIDFSTGTDGQNSVLRLGAASPTQIVSSNAGGYDDGTLANGALITLGGVGDSPTTNDADELYDISSFLTNGQTQISYSLLDVDGFYDDFINVVYFASNGVIAPCQAGTNAPALSANTLTNICPTTTANLTTITASNKPDLTNLTFHTGPTATTANKISGTAVTAGTYYASFFDPAALCYSPTTAITVTIIQCVCYNDPLTGTGIASNHGISLLQRVAGAATTEWPGIRTGAFTVLESNSKGFVITRMTTAQINAIVSPQDGMMVFDTSVSCLKLYDGTAWSCFSTPTCP